MERLEEDRKHVTQYYSIVSCRYLCLNSNFQNGREAKQLTISFQPSSSHAVSRSCPLIYDHRAVVCSAWQAMTRGRGRTLWSAYKGRRGFQALHEPVFSLLPRPSGIINLSMSASKFVSTSAMGTGTLHAFLQPRPCSDADITSDITTPDNPMHCELDEVVQVC